MKPVVGGEWCAARHVGVVLSGRMRVELQDGTTFEIGPNDVFDIPPGHDSYVIGDEPLVEIDWSGLEAWTGFRLRLHDRVLASLLMTDIVGSTTEAARAGDVQWRHRLAEHFEGPFEDRGAHTLKGLEEPRRLYSYSGAVIPPLEQTANPEA